MGSSPVWAGCCSVGTCKGSRESDSLAMRVTRSLRFDIPFLLFELFGSNHNPRRTFCAVFFLHIITGARH
jgi:hypothetical protein